MSGSRELCLPGSVVPLAYSHASRIVKVERVKRAWKSLIPWGPRVEGVARGVVQHARA